MTPDYTPLESRVVAALETEALRYSDYTRAARMNGEKDAAKDFQRAANAFSKALLYWNNGVRPVETAAHNWLIPSQRPDEPPHLLRMSGDWCCTCPAGDTWHWAKALLVGIELAHDNDLDPLPVYDDAPTMDAEPVGAFAAPTPLTRADALALDVNDPARRAFFRALAEQPIDLEWYGGKV